LVDTLRGYGVNGQEVAADDLTAHAARMNADAGSFVAFDAMLFHRAGDNRSGRVRRALNNVLSIPIIAQQISLPSALNCRYRDDPALARLPGYDSSPAASVVDWRTRRLRRSGKPMQ
jgi:ectoine hydroxylase-related dioxygenase (phytanoyl-CoA dioxygenase family)